MSEHLPDVKEVREAALEHRLLSDEQEARAEEIAHKLRFAWAQRKGGRLIVDLRDRVAELEQKIDTCGLQCSATMKSLLAENEKLNADLAFIRRRTGFWGEVPQEPAIPKLLEPWTLVTDGCVVGIFMDQQAYPAISFLRPDNKSVIARGSSKGVFLTTRETSTLRKPRWDDVVSMCMHGTINSASCDKEDCGSKRAAQTTEGGPT